MRQQAATLWLVLCVGLVGAGGLLAALGHPSAAHAAWGAAAVLAAVPLVARLGVDLARGRFGVDLLALLALAGTLLIGESQSSP